MKKIRYQISLNVEGELDKIFKILASQKETFLSTLSWRQMINIADISVAFCEGLSRTLLGKPELAQAVEKKKQELKSAATKLVTKK